MMKFSDFGFKENPFAITPDPRYLFLSRGHEESLAHLIYGTGPNGGFVLLTGEVGTGKTMLVRSLLAQQLGDVEIALVLNPRLSRREFIATICDELGVKYPGPPYSLKKLIDALTLQLLKTHSEGRHTVLVVDEAQNLSPRVLETVRLLTNLETTRHKLLRIILVGQPELLQMLSTKEMRQVDQRITARYHLMPLQRQETARYITHRLAVAGIREDLFTPAAIRLIYRLTEGVPRLINTLCERSLLAIFSRGGQRAGTALVWQAWQDVRGRKQRSPVWRWSVAVVLLAAIGGGVYLQWPALLQPSGDAGTVAVLETGAKEKTVVSSGNAGVETVPKKAAKEKKVASSGDAQAMPTPETGVKEKTVASSGGAQAVTAPETGAKEKTAASSGDVKAVAGPKAGATEKVASISRQTPEPVANEADPPARLTPTESVVAKASPSVVEKTNKAAAGSAVDSSSQAVAKELEERFDLEGLFLRPQSQDLVYQPLFALWGQSLQTDSPLPACEQASELGLRCLRARGDWPQIEDLNRPLLLRLVQGEQSRMLLLKLKDGGLLVVNDGNGEALIETQKLMPYWNGEFVMLWRPPVGVALIGIGTSGEVVTWLRRQLQQFDQQPFVNVAGQDRFDSSLKRRLQAFQRHHGLVDDGVAGQQTLIHLINMSPQPDTPTLMAQTGTEG
jgi:general secretion pathway protein A